MRKISYNTFEQKLAYHTAPALLGIKASGLMSLKDDDAEEQAEKFNKKAWVKGLKIRILCRCRGRALVFLYNEKLLKRKLFSPDSLELLENFGYNKNMTVADCIDRLVSRICCGGDFPHEIGIFLDYPTEDVKGFIENGGENFKLCGCWKVYGDTEKAKRTFSNYEKCRNYLCGRLNQGFDFYKTLKIS